jgi:hypothetical protein
MIRIHISRNATFGALALALAACGNNSTNSLLEHQSGEGTPNDPTIAGGQTTDNPEPGGLPSLGVATTGTPTTQNPNIVNRTVNYGEALRTASLKLLGVLPTLAELNAMSVAEQLGGNTASSLYASQIDAMLADPRFADRMVEYWRNTFKTGDQGQQGQMGAPDFDTAANFAAMVVLNDRPYTDILTASSETCPTYTKGKFTPAECGNGAPTTGVLTDPGIQAQYFGHLAFRRVRFIQETFVCSPMPAEYSSDPKPMGTSMYTSPWDFDSIAGGAKAQINFQDTSSVICANCHTTLNHIAPLFAYFDENGAYQAGMIQVQTPVVPPVTSVLSDWLPSGQGFAWRNGTPVTDIPSLGKAIAADPDVLRCAVTRIWDWAFSRGDVVLNLATVPTTVTDPVLKDFQANGLKLKQVIRDVFTSNDFIQF